MYGDPAALRQLAATIVTSADTVRSDARGAVAEAEATQWQGAAADSHREHVQAVASALQVIATRLDEAAEDLQAYAARVAAVQAEIATAERAVTQYFEGALSALESGASSVVGSVQQAAGGVEHFVLGVVDGSSGGAASPPWQSWPWSPDNPPAPGSKDWLDLGNLAFGSGFSL